MIIWDLCRYFVKILLVQTNQLRSVFKTVFEFAAVLAGVCIIIFISSTINFDPKDEISFTKALTRLSFILIAIYILINLLLLTLKQNVKIIEVNIFIIYSMFVGYLTSMRIFILDETPYDFNQGYGAGDKNGITRMIYDLQSNLNYPPGLPLISKAIANFLGLKPVFGMKLAQVVILVFGLIILFIILGKTINYFFSGFYSITISMYFITLGDEYKVIPLLLMSVILYLILFIHDSDFQFYFKFFLNFISSVLLGIFFLIYSGPLFWNLLLFFGVIIFVLFGCYRKEGPKAFFTSGLSLLVPFFLLSFLHIQPYVLAIFSTVSRTGVVLLGDNYMYEDAINSVLRAVLIVDPTFRGLLIIIALLAIFKIKNPLNTLIYVFAFSFVSAVLIQFMMNLNWQKSGFLELWPRGWLNSAHAIYSLFLIGFYLAVEKVLSLWQAMIKFRVADFRVPLVGLIILVSTLGAIDQKYSSYSYNGSNGSGTKIAHDALNYEIPCYEDC